MLFFAIALLWACIGSVDIIATAQGKIVPTGRTKVIQPLESGVVHAIHVQDGQKVKGGRRADRNRHHHQRRRTRPPQNDYMQAMLDTRG
jgi:hemolysin D